MSNPKVNEPGDGGPEPGSDPDATGEPLPPDPDGGTPVPPDDAGTGDGPHQSGTTGVIPEPHDGGKLDYQMAEDIRHGTKPGRE